MRYGSSYLVSDFILSSGLTVLAQSDEISADRSRLTGCLEWVHQDSATSGNTSGNVSGDTSGYASSNTSGDTSGDTGSDGSETGPGSSG